MRGRGIDGIVRGAACAALAGVSLACGSALESLAPVRHAAAALPPAELEGVLFEGYHGEARDLFVTSDSAIVDMGERVAHLSGVRLTLAEPTRGAIEVAAPTGEFKLDDDDFLLTGGVDGTAGKGEQFTTETIRYVAAGRKLVSDDPVALRREGFDLRADGLTLDLDTRRLRLVGKVQAKVRPR